MAAWNVLQHVFYLRAEFIRRAEADGVIGMSDLKRYNLVLPEELFAELERMAVKRHTSVVEVLRRYIKLGLLVEQIDERPGAELLIREGERERQIVLI
jgi:hypothetical protein